MHLSKSRELAPMHISYCYGGGVRFGSGRKPSVHFQGEMLVDQLIAELPAIAERHGSLTIRHAGYVVHFYFLRSGHTFEYFPEEASSDMRGLEGTITIAEVADSLRCIDKGGSLEAFLVVRSGARWVNHA